MASQITCNSDVYLTNSCSCSQQRKLIYCPTMAAITPVSSGWIPSQRDGHVEKSKFLQINYKGDTVHHSLPARVWDMKSLSRVRGMTYTCVAHYIRLVSQIRKCLRQISHNAAFCNRNVHTFAHFLYKMLHCGIWDWCIDMNWCIVGLWIWSVAVDMWYHVITDRSITRLPCIVSNYLSLCFMTITIKNRIVIMTME